MGLILSESIMIYLDLGNTLNYFFFLLKNSVHASIITAVKVVSLSNAYCFNCLTKLLGRSHVVLTFIDSCLDMQFLCKKPYIQ